MVGDPSGRSDMRTVMDVEEIDNNCNHFKKLLGVKFTDKRVSTGNLRLY